jgi:hypothetical protein
MLQVPPTPYFPSPFLLNQFCNFHPGVVKSLADPEGRGRAQIECPGLLGSGNKNWTCWVEWGGTPVGSSKDKGDEGDWWPLQVGQCVLVGFVCGEPDALWMLPGPPCADGAEQQIPAEPKSYNDGRKITRCRIRKSEAGHTLLMDDNGKSELFAMLNWTGSGIAFYGPGTEEDEKESPDEESKPRKGKRRGTKNVFAGTAPKPSEIVDGGIEYGGMVDLWRQGILSIASDENGGCVMIAARKKDGSLGPSLVLDAVNDAYYLSTSEKGATQIQGLGKAQAIYTTCQMIWEPPFKKVAGVFSGILDQLKKAFKKYDE